MDWCFSVLLSSFKAGGIHGCSVWWSALQPWHSEQHWKTSVHSFFTLYSSSVFIDIEPCSCRGNLSIDLYFKKSEILRILCDLCKNLILWKQSKLSSTIVQNNIPRNPKSKASKSHKKYLTFRLLCCSLHLYVLGVLQNCTFLQSDNKYICHKISCKETCIQTQRQEIGRCSR